MKCPTCETVDLVMTDRQGVEIDYCPKCRGVWLDRGELDKIIERAARYDDDDDRPAATSRPAPAPSYPQSQPPPPPPYYGDHGKYHDYRYKKRKSFWQELFD